MTTKMCQIYFQPGQARTLWWSSLISQTT